MAWGGHRPPHCPLRGIARCIYDNGPVAAAAKRAVDCVCQHPARLRRICPPLLRQHPARDLAGRKRLTGLPQHRKRLSTSRPPWRSCRVLHEAALGRDLREVVAGLEHLDDVIDVRQFNLKAHDLIASRFDIPIDASALVHQGADYVCACHTVALRILGDYI